jgi:hypothetical protein
MKQEIKITCDTKLYLPLENILDFQGELKSLSSTNYERLKKQILEQGFSAPIFVWKNNAKYYCLDGTQRRLVLTRLKAEGYKIPDLPAVEIFAKTKLEAKKKLLSYVSQFGKVESQGLYEFIIEAEIPIEDMSDFEIPEIDMDDFKAEYFADEPPAGAGSEDNIPEVELNELGVKLGDIFQLGEHRLMCGSSLEIDQVKKLMDGNFADLWIADPPFGVSYVEKNAAVHGGIVKNAVGKEIKSDTKTVKELMPFWKSASECAYAVTTDKASNYWCACQGSDKMMMMMMMMMDEAGWNIRHELIWVKSSFVFGRSDYHYRHEPIIYGWKKKGTHEWHGDRKQSSVFEIDRPHNSELHPTTKPVELFSHFIKNSTQAGQKVFESFGGSGTTLIACEALKRTSFTMELDPHYCSVIIKRWEEYTGKKHKKLS